MKLGFVLGLALLGAMITALSSLVSSEVTARYPDILRCAHSCVVSAAGWPVPFVVDYPGLSPAGKASLAGAVLGLDRLRLDGLLLNVLFWSGIAAGLLPLFGLVTRWPARARRK